MYAGNIGINDAGRPCTFEAVFGAGIFKPKRMTAGERTCPVKIPVSIDINHLTVNTASISTAKTMENDFRVPVRRDKQTDAAIKTGNDI